MNTNLKPVPGYRGYFANSNGDVFSSWKKIPNCISWGIAPGFYKLLKPDTDKDGYLHVVLKKKVGNYKRRPLHHVILEAHGFFRTKAKNVVRHLNNVRNDNRIKNIVWGTPQENIDDAVRANSLKGENAGLAKLTNEQALEIYKWKGFAKNIAPKYGIDLTCVYAIRNGKTWTHVTGHASKS